MTKVLIPAALLTSQPPDDVYRYGSYRVGRSGVIIPADQLRRLDADTFEWQIKR